MTWKAREQRRSLRNGENDRNPVVRRSDWAACREPEGAKVQLHGWILMEIWLNMPSALTVCPSGKILTDQNKLVLQFELLMFGFPSFFAALPDEISAADVQRTELTLGLLPLSPPPGGPLSQLGPQMHHHIRPAGRAPAIYLKCRNKIPRKRRECTLTTTAFTPVCLCQCSQWRPLPG